MAAPEHSEPVDTEHYRTFWRRFWAGLIDGFVLYPLVWIDQWIWGAVTSTVVLVPWYVGHASAFALYSVLLHGCFGQTVGKFVMDVKVFDVRGSRLSMKKALLRDGVYIAVVAYSLVSEIPIVLDGRNPSTITTEFGFAILVSAYALIGWYLLEIITMLFNRKRRAIHDYIAGSVVMRV